jgi:gas vesicle protein
MSYYEQDNPMSDFGPMIGVFAAGVLIGGLAGALTMLLVAPQSGERTRRQIRRKALELREQVADNAEEAREKAEESLEEALERVRKVRKEALNRVDDAQQRGQEMIDQQRERVKDAVEAGKGVMRRQARHN